MPIFPEPPRAPDPAAVENSLVEPGSEALRLLRESEERLTLALRAANQGIYDLNVQTGEAVVSAEYARMLGHEPAEFHETNAAWIERLHPDDHARVAGVYRDYIAGKIPEYRVEFRQRTRSGEWKWILSLGRLVQRDAAGRPLRMLGTHTDITERKNAEDRIRRLGGLYAALSHCNQAIVRCAQEDELFPLVCRDAVMFGGMTMAWIGMLDLAGGRVRPVAAFGAGIDYLSDIRISVAADEPWGHGPTGGAIRAGQPVWCEDFLADPDTAAWHESARRFGWAASAALPLRRNGASVGALNVYVTAAAAFDDETRSLLLEMATDISFALDNFAREAERKTAVDALREKTALLENVINSSADYIFVKDRELRTVLCNEILARALGKTPAELYGKTDIENGWSPELVLGRPEEGIRGFQQDDLAAVGGEVVHNYDDRGNIGGEIRSFDSLKVPLRGADGRIFGLLGISRDITERKAAEDRMRKFSLAVEQSPESIVITDVQGRIEYVNEAFVRTTGYASADLIGQNPRVLQSGRTPQATYVAMWQTLALGQTWKGVFHNRKKDGAEYVEFAIVTPLRQSDGSISHYVAVKEDITEKRRVGEELDLHRHHLEELVTQRTAELLAARQQADAANQAKSAFLANMSHEIRTPMNAIVGLTHLLQAAAPTPEQSDRLAKIDKAAFHLLSIINDILDISKIEAGRLQLEQSDFTLESVLGYVQSMIAGQAADKGLVVETDNGAPGVCWRGDQTRLRQALLNYAANAVKFTERGRILLRARPLDPVGEGAWRIRFEVHDKGIGIAAPTLPKLFEAFEQADVSTTRRYGGTGLGLAITRRLARLMGGEAGAESELGKGSIFWFTASLAAGSGALPPVEAVTAADVAADLSRRYRGARLLLVEDDPVNREVALEQLRNVDLNADQAMDGREAVARVRAAEYDLILMDMQMPVLDGIAATREIRALPGRAHLPIIAMTANVFEEDRRVCLDAGMDDFLAKPVVPERLYAMLRKWLAVKLEESPAPPAVVADEITRRLAAIPGFDPARALAAVRNRPERLLRLLRLFLEGHATDPEDLASLLAAGRLEEIRRHAHGLKGSAGNLGAAAVQQAAEEVLAALRTTTEPALVAPGTRRLAAELARLNTAIRELLADAAPVVARVDTARAAGIIEQLEAMLQSGNIKSNELARVEEDLLRAALGPEGDEILRLIARYDYEDALLALQRRARF